MRRIEQPQAEGAGWAHLRVMSLATGLSFVVITLTRPLVPLLAVHLGARAAEVGAVVGAYALVPLLLAVPAGALVDRVGSRRIFLWGSLGIAVGLAAVGAWPSLPVLVVTQAGVGLSQLLVIVAGQTYATSLARGVEREAQLGWYTTLVSAGQLVGPLVGGVLADALGYGPSFRIAAFLGLLPLAVGFAVHDVPRRSEAGAPGGEARLAEAEPPGEVRSAPRAARGSAIRRIAGIGGVRLAVVASFSINFAMGARQGFYPLYVQNLGYPATLVGSLLSLRALASMSVRPFMVRIVAAAGGRFRTVFGSMLLGAAAVGITPWTREPLGLALASVALGVGIGLVHPLSMLAVAETVAEEERGLALGMRLTGNRLAQFTSPVLFGAVAEAAGLEAAFVAGGLVLAAATFSLLFWRATFAHLDRWPGRQAAGRGPGRDG
ncbi:MFS transporter [Limnochorda pilosa]|uniref:MFS transporter n=1 Tax=Limnochorda pilosa TaxID=1555112 RepID=A0A0K2SMM9_LIMPI|nr:MFS transporter [Limnochorda pilosa]BAS28257.1 MFS transporter [Limnochorda pilosa]